ncbi:MAG: creatininase family protein [Gemmatimonadota bacterium]
MKIADMTWEMVEAYLAHDDRCILPLGSTEQHALISLATDSILAERVSVEAAEPLGIPVFPALAYGITPYFMGYPGTVSLSPNVYEQVLTEMLASVRRHGFRRLLIVNGHGGNSPAREAVRAWAERKAEVDVRWHDWWSAPNVRAAIDEVDPDASHASWMETFPWTRVAGVELPDRHKPPVDLSGRDDISLSGFRARIGDGSFGGWYERPPEVMERVWSIAVAETRARLTDGGWS